MVERTGARDREWLWAVATGFAAVATPCELGRHLGEPGRPVDALVLATSTYEVRVRSWTPGTWTDLHLHHALTGALCVVSGTLVEVRLGAGTTTTRRELGAGDGVVYDEHTAHRVGNVGPDPAITVHVTTAHASAELAAAC